MRSCQAVFIVIIFRDRECVRLLRRLDAEKEVDTIDAPASDGFDAKVLYALSYSFVSCFILKI